MPFTPGAFGTETGQQGSDLLIQSLSSFGLVGTTTNPTGATWKAALNTSASLDAGTNYRVRVRLENTGSADGTAFKWQYNRNGAGWNDITTTSSVVKAVNSTYFADGDHCSELLTGSGTYKTVNASADETGVFTLSSTLDTNQAVEAELCFSIVTLDVINNDSLQIRVVYSTGALEAYTNTPTITVIAAGATTALGIAATSSLINPAQSTVKSVFSVPSVSALSLIASSPEVPAVFSIPSVSVFTAGGQSLNKASVSIIASASASFYPEATPGGISFSFGSSSQIIFTGKSRMVDKRKIGKHRSRR